MNEYSAVLLVEVFDRTSLRVKFDSARHRSCELFVWETDSSNLGIECAGDERANQMHVITLLVPASLSSVPVILVVEREDSHVF